MVELKANKNGSEICQSWIVYTDSKDEVISIQKKIDNIFSGYSFFPEIDWAQYGYRPPEGYQILGAWRHPTSKVFVFLLDAQKTKTARQIFQLLLYIAGNAEEIETLKPKIKQLKARIASADRKERLHIRIGERLDQVQKSKSLAIIITILTIFTGIINGFSLYLRKLPPPEFVTKNILAIYRLMVIFVHFSALFLLLVVIVITALFLIKYGILLFRRL